MLPDYEIACEHEHSNCVLIAHKKVRMFAVSICSTEKYILLLCVQFYIDGKWHTWIDFDKFIDLVSKLETDE